MILSPLTISKQMHLVKATNTDKNSTMAKKTSTEIERKWLVGELPDLSGSEMHEIDQGDIAIAGDGTEVRLRHKGMTYFLTVKSDGGLERVEIEIELTKEQFDSLWKATESRRLKKTRYELTWSNTKIELDVYKGSLQGLLVAEVEFPSVAESVLFSPLSWFGREITEDIRYKNKNLAMKGVPDATQ